MYANTLVYDRLAQQLSALTSQRLVLPTRTLKLNHEKIQSKLGSLSRYFQKISKQSENMERKIQNLVVSIQEGKPQFHIGKRFDWISLLMKKDGRSSLSLNYSRSWKEVSVSKQNKYMQAGANLDLGHFQAQGECSFGVWKKKQLDPHLLLDMEAMMSVTSGNLYGQLGNRHFGIYANAQGDVGCVYARAKAVINRKEQSLDVGVGAAAIRGEASISFRIFGAKVRLTGSGSIGSAEASLSYKHSSREWAFGSKLGFIAGLGFKVHVSY